MTTLKSPVADERREPRIASNLALASLTDYVSDGDLRALVIDTLKNDPRTSFEQIVTRLRVRTGRVIPSAEAERLQTIHQAEGYAAQASESRTSEAARLAGLATFIHYRPNTQELIGLAAGSFHW